MIWPPAGSHEPLNLNWKITFWQMKGKNSAAEKGQMGGNLRPPSAFNSFDLCPQALTDQGEQRFVVSTDVDQFLLRLTGWTMSYQPLACPSMAPARMQEQEG